MTTEKSNVIKLAEVDKFHVTIILRIKILVKSARVS